MSKDQLRQEILSLVAQYADLQYAPQGFQAGISTIPPSGKVLGVNEIQNMVEAALDGWLTAGRFNDAFQKRLADLLRVRES